MWKLIYFSFLVIFILTSGCKREVVFDENDVVNNQIKKGIYEYILLTINPNENLVISIHKNIKGDTIEFVINTRNSIVLFEQDSVYYRAKYLNTYVFSNFKNNSFKDSCNLKEAAKSLNKEEYEYFIKKNEIPPPFILLDIMKMKMVFVNGKLLKKEFHY